MDWNSLSLNVIEVQSKTLSEPSWTCFDYSYFILIISYYH